ncbi:DUF6895 family protein [Streptomyces aidingensis]|uniref:DUF6895 domain-containing protein n=1 Tax=Streptomyces aidingensis TaxID=910347 RepID=A0A1I1IKS8_9ACTN|nr:hypothetical protein [Streptomyces aidingensis]SFC36836.1 hypothetical protein SAMN05421773_10397 [Streptomyces aidingensis]
MTAAPAVPGPVRDTARLLADRALSWLHANRRFGALPPGTTETLDDPDSTYKPLGESALAASLVLRDPHSGAGRRAAAQNLLDYLWEQFRAGDLLYERQLRHTLMTDPMETYSHFARAGYRHAELDRLLAHHSRLRSLRAVEVVPNRRLAVANAARVVGLAPLREDDWAALARATWLGAEPEPWAVDWMTAYHMTHTVFHLTDWSARPEGLPAPLAAYLHDWLPVWTDIWREVAQWDLLAELLIVGACLPEPYCDPGHWEALAGIQRPDGLVPRDGEPVTDDPEQRFHDHQHTVAVVTVAGTALAGRAGP